MSMVRIAHRDGLRRVECLERCGDWAITRSDVCPHVLTHLPTGWAIPDDGYDLVELRWLLEQLSALPHYDLQTIDLERVWKVLNP